MDFPISQFILASTSTPNSILPHSIVLAALLTISTKMSSLVSLAPTPFSRIPKCLRPKTNLHRFLPKLPPKFPPYSCSPKRLLSPLTPRASVGGVDYDVEPATNVKFPKELTVPGCSDSLVLLGTGYREKVFAIIGVKVYASGFYAKYSIKDALEPWKGKSADEVLADSSLFSSIFNAPLEKSLKIILVRNVDGKTFWNALNDVISPRIKEPTPGDESALSTFRNTFQDRDLKQGTLILLTWVEPSKMLVSISCDGFPTNVDAEIESVNVTSSLFDAFFGESPVSPTLKASVANGLAVVLN